MPVVGLRNGFTLFEMLAAVAIIGVLGMLALPMYGHYRETVRIGEARSAIRELEGRITRYASASSPMRYPDSLADVGGAPLDPWGNAYRYLNIENLKPPQGQLRKDKNLVPINSDYDLYSVGADGATTGALSARASRDDVVRANNGQYVGLAEDY